MKTQKLLFSSILATGLAFNASCSDYENLTDLEYEKLLTDLADPSKGIFKMGNKVSLISTPRALCAATSFLIFPASLLVSEKLVKKNPDLENNKIYKSAIYSLVSLGYSLPYIIGHSEKRPFLFAAKCALISNLLFFTSEIIEHLKDTINEKLNKLY